MLKNAQRIFHTFENIPFEISLEFVTIDKILANELVNGQTTTMLAKVNELI